MHRAILLALTALISSCASPKFESVGDRRIDIISDKLIAIGCEVDEDAIRNVADGKPLTIRHSEDPRGNCTVIFTHVVLPKGTWELRGTKNSDQDSNLDDVPDSSWQFTEGIGVILTGDKITTTPREFASDTKPYTMLYARVDRQKGWDAWFAHSWEARSQTNGCGYFPPSGIEPTPRNFPPTQIPLISSEHYENGKHIAGVSYWFEKR